MTSRSVIVISMLLSLVAIPASATTGVLDFMVRDSLTHHPVQAVIKGEGPQSFSAATDAKGIFHLTLPAGQYLLEVSSAGYSTLRTYYLIESGKSTTGGAYLDPERLPGEESRAVLDELLRPDHSLLHEYVTDAKTGAPLPNVKVSSSNAGASTETDANGHFALLLPTPAPENPGGVGVDTLTYEKAGYKTLVLRNVAIAPDEMGPSVVELEKGNGTQDRDATHKLMRNDSLNELPSQSGLPGPALSPVISTWLGKTGTSFPVGAAANSGTPIGELVTVPNSIKVGHNCSVSNNQIVCTSFDPAISLETYVSNGLLGEWLSSWVDDSLKAGSVAYRSYGAWYVAHPLSPNYDICDNALCQVYNPSTFKPTTREKADVSATVGVVLSNDGVNVFKAEYAAESNLASDTQFATCGDGNVGEPANNWPCMIDFVDKGKSQASTHSRGMCQRGSQRWASGKDSTGAPGDTGQPIVNSNGVAITARDWRCIIDHYYNANSNSGLVDPNIVSGIGEAGTGLRTAFMQFNSQTYGLIAYEAYNSSGESIRAANAADGSGDYAITSAPGFYPSWEPGGKRLVYDTGNNGLAIINSDGTGLTQLTTHAYDHAPAWSPLGNKIAFCSTGSGPWNTDVWLINPDGTGLQQITVGLSVQEQGDFETEDCYLRWSPDGSRITFTGLTANIPFASTYNVYTMKADGSNVLQLTNCLINGGSANGPSDCGTPSWSPNGNTIAWFDGDTPFGDSYGGGGIYTMNVDGTGVTPVFQAENFTNVFPQWSSDGSRIFFTSSPSGWGVYSINPGGSGYMQVIGAAKGFKYQTQGSIDCSHCPNFNE